MNRAELGDFDALVLGLLLMAHFEGTVCVPDLGFYGRDAHTSLIRERRLIAGVNYLDELKRKAPELRDAVMLIPEKIAQGAIYDDAVELARYKGLQPQTNEFNDFVAEALG